MRKRLVKQKAESWKKLTNAFDFLSAKMGVEINEHLRL
jgi:hypothetical protein